MMNLWTWGAEQPIPVSPEADLRVIGYEDAFRNSEAPFQWEERTSESGRTYTVKVYDPEAYTADFMFRSDESGRLMRWGVRIADGRLVSRDAIFRMRFPAAWSELRAKWAKLRGEKREEAIASALWERLSREEQGELIAGARLDEYVDARGLNQSLADAGRDLRASGNILGWVGVDRDNMRDAYATRFLGGPIGSTLWLAAPWAMFLSFKDALRGMTRASYAVEDLPLFDSFVSLGKHGERVAQYGAARWWGDAGEFFANSPLRSEEARSVLRAIERRLGGPTMADEVRQPWGNARVVTVEDRRATHAREAQRMERLDPAWRAEAKRSPGALHEVLRYAHGFSRGLERR